MKLETVLAPSDLEEGSLPGLRVAAFLAGQASARLVVVHVLTSRSIDTTEPIHHEVPLREQAVRHAGEALERQIADLGPGLSVTTHVAWGDPVDEILRLAADEDADVIVITGKNRSRVGKLLMGSQVQRIILESNRPVLTVPRRTRRDA